MWTPGNFSSCKKLPTISESPHVGADRKLTNPAGILILRQVGANVGVQVRVSRLNGDDASGFHHKTERRGQHTVFLREPVAHLLSRDHPIHRGWPRDRLAFREVAPAALLPL